MSSFSVRKLRSGNWSLREESWSDGKPSTKTVPKFAYESLGIRAEMSLDEAKARVQQLNKSKSLERKSMVGAANRVVKLRIVESVFIPPVECDEFFQKLKRKSFGGKEHQKRLLSHWQYVQKMIAELKIEPIDYADEQDQFYHYFIDQANSSDYANKLIRILNMWGFFICRKRGQFFEPVERPRGKILAQINETYQESDTFVGPSEPLTPAILEAARGKLTVPGNYEWLFISVWFGLRPSEIDSLKVDGKWRVEELEDFDALWVYQSKLTSLKKEDRWKGIPMIYKEQIQALEYIKNGTFKKPLYKTMWAVFGEKISLYGGRKNFEPMMIEKGNLYHDVSSWMGHQTVDTTWKKYRNRKRVSYSKAE